MYLVTVIRNPHDSECGVEIGGLFTSEEKAIKAREKIKAWLKAEEYEEGEVFVINYEERINRLDWYELKEEL